RRHALRAAGHRHRGDAVGRGSHAAAALRRGPGLLRAADQRRLQHHAHPQQRGPSYADSAGGEAPWVYIMTPDPNYTFLRGATIVLHGSGWDLEDNGLNGDSLVWTSNVDGQIGTGRLTHVNTL